MDLEGCLVPEIWIELANKSKIAELKLTTRDIADYDLLMAKRLAILKENKLTIQDIQSITSQLEPLSGAKSFLEWLRLKFPLSFFQILFMKSPSLSWKNSLTLLCFATIWKLRKTATSAITTYVTPKVKQTPYRAFSKMAFLP